MAIRTYTLAATAVPQRLSDVYGGTPGVLNPRTDIPYRQIMLQAADSPVFVGMDNTVTTALYGFQISVSPVDDLRLGPFDQGPLKLSDFWVVGAGGNLHILGVPY